MTYQDLLKSIKSRIRQSQIKAAMSVNAEMVMLYWEIGRMIDERQGSEGWGRGVIPRLAKDIKNELSDVKGFSVRNLGRMVAFYREYKELTILPVPLAKLPFDASLVARDAAESSDAGESPILPTPLAKLCNPLIKNVLLISWASNVALMEKVKDCNIRQWYMERIIEQGWTFDHLISMIKTDAHARQGRAMTNFADRLPVIQSALAQELLKDPYVFDFLTLEEPYRESELEAGLVQHLEKFLMELGSGFAFVGRQYHIEAGENDFYIDLLFYHLKLRCYMVIELKKGAFKSEYAGKLNLYCAVVDDILRHPQDNPTIGLILCQTKDRVLAEYALRTSLQPIGVSEYDLTRALPDELKSSLPSIEDIEEAMVDVVMEEESF
jgi:predicted nuclease of restriction endonuclease-like (RecB) superfamily